ncbi:protein kinase activating protein dpb11 [Exophiala xenobiotica]|uniref:Protein kinase activating protein dpb11 n=1 Tax=Lithohypha guttulata TaxID=1690604 RepID=A0ABR0JV77_9EURO|nr:protein kinase activating protein dpb11 [Lithohypha guttulata]KAK5309084.1 protein kinase activating protein dpb11 [Exophiala xenobiotica]
MTDSASKLLAEKPLNGAQLCCTSIPPESRSQLAEWAQEMGADHTLDLTSDVTHLLVGDTDSAKYRYVARERQDVKVLLPEYIQALRELWMNDQPIDLNALDAQYKCPTLFGLKICITGFEDLDFRNELAKNIVKNGGEYTGDLTKDVTHLIAFTPEGKKYEFAKTWKLKIVSIKWYKDTLDRGMQLDEEKYHPTILPEHQGVGAWNRQNSSSAKAGKRQRIAEPAQQASRKLRRTASAKFGSQQNDVWNDIVGQHDPKAIALGNTELKSTKSLPSIDAAVVIGAGDDPHPEKRAQSHMQRDLLNRDRNTDTGILTGKHFHVKGFDDRRKAVLHRTLFSHGGTVHDTLTDLKKEAEQDTGSCFMIVPFEIESHRLATFEQTCPNVTIVTELWLEWCMTSNTFISPENYALGLPATPIHLPAASKLVINATGFPQRQTLHISKTIQKLGAVYQENFTQDTTVLVCNSANLNRRKIEHAQAWRMPVVSEKWLWQLIKNGRVPSFEPFTLVRMAQEAPVKQAERATRPSKVDHKNETETPPHHSPRERRSGSEEDSFIDAARDIQARDQEKQKPLSDGSARKALEENQRNRRNNAQNDSQGSSKSVSANTTLALQKSIPLQEVSGNKLPRRSSPPKKKLFQTFDGHSSDKTELRPNADPQAETADTHTEAQQDDEGLNLNADDAPSPVVPPALPEPKSHSALLNEFFEVKAAAEARQRAEAAADTARPASRTSNKKKLLGRALSNLSNSSRTSNDISKGGNGYEKQALSRASSINSINTDGLGVPLSALSRIPSELQKKDQVQEQQTRTLRGNALLSRDSMSAVPSANPPQPAANVSLKGMADLDFHAALTTLSTSQPPRPPSPTQQPQLTYADSSQAMALKARLAEKRRNRARLGQREGDPEPPLSREDSEEKRQQEYKDAKTNALDRVVRDDEALVGAGRRTRGRQKALSKMFDGVAEEGLEGLGAGNIF